MRGLIAVGVGILAVVGGAVLAAEDKVVFLDVGQGDAILLQDGHRQVLVDGGKGNAVLARLAEEMPLLDRRVEVVVLTHPQQDHMEGLLHVLERYDVGMVLLPQAANTSKLQAAWMDMLIGKDIPYRFAWYGQQLQVGDMDIKVLGPFDTPAGEAATRRDVNNASTITRIDFNGMSFLLTGDAEAPVERMLVRTVAPELLDADVLKAGHHGSKSSTTAALLSAASPSAVVISVGEDNRFGHPHPNVLARLDKNRVWRTDEDGSVRFPYRDGRWFVSVK